MTRVGKASMLYGPAVVLEVLEHGTADAIGKLLTCTLEAKKAKKIIHLVGDAR